MADGTRDVSTKKKTDRLKKLVATIEGLMDGQFTGYIKLNFIQGSIGRIEKFEEILKK
jgi:hypothetical protein